MTYITNQFNAWRNGTRKDVSGLIMAGIAAKLNAEQVKAVAAYYEAQQPR